MVPLFSPDDDDEDGDDELEELVSISWISISAKKFADKFYSSENVQKTSKNYS
jgi:hypothetical protein